MVMCVLGSGFCLMIEAAFVFKTCIISLVVCNCDLKTVLIGGRHEVP